MKVLGFKTTLPIKGRIDIAATVRAQKMESVICSYEEKVEVWNGTERVDILLLSQRAGRAARLAISFPQSHGNQVALPNQPDGEVICVSVFRSKDNTGIPACFKSFISGPRLCRVNDLGVSL